MDVTDSGARKFHQQPRRWGTRLNIPARRIFTQRRCRFIFIFIFSKFVCVLSFKMTFREFVIENTFVFPTVFVVRLLTRPLLAVGSSPVPVLSSDTTFLSPLPSELGRLIARPFSRRLRVNRSVRFPTSFRNFFRSSFEMFRPSKFPLFSSIRFIVHRIHAPSVFGRLLE